MFLQRLIVAGDDNFNYDYMGAAEYENGVTTRAREELARLAINKKLAGRHVRFFTKYGMLTSGPIAAVVFGEESYLNEIIKDAPVEDVPGDLFVTEFKENPRINDVRYQGWLKVTPHVRDNDPIQPILIIRNIEDNFRRGNEYINLIARQILKAAWMKERT